MNSLGPSKTILVVRVYELKNKCKSKLPLLFSRSSALHEERWQAPLAQLLRRSRGFQAWRWWSDSSTLLWRRRCLKKGQGQHKLKSSEFNRNQPGGQTDQVWPCQENFVSSNELINVEWPSWKIWRADVWSVSERRRANTRYVSFPNLSRWSFDLYDLVFMSHTDAAKQRSKTTSLETKNLSEVWPYLEL